MVGSSVELSCVDPRENTFDLKELHVYWQITVGGKLKSVAHYLSGNNSTGYDGQYEDRAQLSLDGMRQGTFSLRLNNVTPQDEQKFNCLVFRNLESVLNVTVTLHVAGEGVGRRLTSAPGEGPARRVSGQTRRRRRLPRHRVRSGTGWKPPAHRKASPPRGPQARRLGHGLATSTHTRLLKRDVEGALEAIRIQEKD